MDNCDRIKCSAYYFGKGYLRLNKTNTTKKNRFNELNMNKDNLLAANMVSVGNYISQASGRIYYSNFKSDTYYMFSGGCVFIDHVSVYMFINNQLCIKCTETFKAEITFGGSLKVRGYQSRYITLPRGYLTPRSSWGSF